MINIPVATQELGWEISHLFYQLSKPVLDPEDITKYYCNVQPITGTDKYYLRMPNQEYFPIHVDANNETLDQVLAPFLAQGLITQEDLDNVHNDIEVNKGGKTVIAASIPQVWIDMAVDDEFFEPDYVAPVEETVETTEVE